MWGTTSRSEVTVSLIDKTSIGRSVRSMEAQESEPYSRVVVYDSRGNKFESGDESGKTFYLENPFASQAVADRLAQNIVGFSYQPYSAKGAVIDPAAEIGDAISIHGLYSSIFQEDSSYGPQYAANIGAPGEEELTHEIPYISPADRKIIRLNASVGRLGTAIKKETEDRLFDSKQIKASITGMSEHIGRVEAGLDSYVLATDFNETLGKYQTIIASNELAARIDGDVAGLTQRVTQTNTELETVRTASNNVYAALGVEYNDDGTVKSVEALATLDQKVVKVQNDTETITSTITEISSKVDGAEAKITLNAKNINGVASSVATIQADVINLKGRVDVTGILSITNGALTSSGPIYAPNQTISGGTLKSQYLYASSGFYLQDVKYAPTAITSTTGTVLVLGAA